MRKVILTLETQTKFELIKRLVDENGNKKAAALKLNCTIRHINRLISRYKREGKSTFVHGNTGRKPVHTLTDEQKSDIITLYNNKYWDANFTHCCELMEKHDSIKISPSTLRKILYSEFILSPRATRKTRKQMNKILKELHKNTKSKKKKAIIEASIIAIEDSHSRRPRCAYFGEMLQMDASLHLWYGDTKATLHIAIDDCTGTIVGAYFDEQETLKGYYNVLNQTLCTYGIPHMFYTDNRTVFEYKKKSKASVEDDTYTQFSYACKQLGIEIKTTSIAQAKGRVERAFQTLQLRLPIELRLAGISTLSEANVFLNSYIKEYNTKFALRINHNKSVFIPQPDSDTINQTLAILTERTIDNGHCIRFDNKFYKVMNSRGLQVYYHKGVKGMVIKTFNNELLFSTHDKVYVLDEIPQHERKSKNFDIDFTIEKPRKRNIPNMRHPWRSDTFQKHAKYALHPRDLTA
jgi:transposase